MNKPQGQSCLLNNDINYFLHAKGGYLIELEIYKEYQKTLLGHIVIQISPDCTNISMPELLHFGTNLVPNTSEENSRWMWPQEVLEYLFLLRAGSADRSSAAPRCQSLLWLSQLPWTEKPAGTLSGELHSFSTTSTTSFADICKHTPWTLQFKLWINLG